MERPNNYHISNHPDSKSSCNNVYCCSKRAKQELPQSHKKTYFTFFFRSVLTLHLIFASILISFYPMKQAHAGLFFDLIDYLVGGVSAEDNSASEVTAISLPLLGSSPSLLYEHTAKDGLDDTNIMTTTQDNAIIASRNPLGTLSSDKDQIFLYTIQQGDTLSGVAASFGVTVNTILWANNIRDPKSIKVGDELVILPVTGIQYKVKKGDTLDSIVKQFKPKDEDITHEDFLTEIISFNGLAIGEILETGSVIIIPEGEFTSPVQQQKPGSKPISNSTSFVQYPEYRGYYLRPIIGGRRSRGIHGYNGVDLANICGFPVLASASGSVIVARTSGWNGGYGKYIVIAHPNGTQTLYAHMQILSVSVGQSVVQGFKIGQIGSTGNSTGCHVHFEIRGAKNPF